MDKIRLGIIGTGMAFEKLHYPALQKLKDKYKIVAICDVDKFKIDKWKNTLGLDDSDIYVDYRQMMGRNDIDAFDIIVPIELNFKVMEEVAKARKPIICEKPLTPNLKYIRAARDLPKKYNIPIMIAENYHYNDEIKMLNYLVHTNKVGDIFYFIWNRVMDFPKEMKEDKFAAREWRQYPDFPGGAILDTGVHEISALRHIFKDVNRVQAFGKVQEQDFAPYSVITSNIEFKNGVIGNYTFFCAGPEPFKPKIGLRIFGTEGMIYLEDKRCRSIKVTYSNGKMENLPFTPEQGYFNEFLNFYNAINGKEELLVTPEIEYKDAKILFAILKSANENRIIELEKEDLG